MVDRIMKKSTPAIQIYYSLQWVDTWSQFWPRCIITDCNKCNYHVNALTLCKWKYTDNYTDTLHYKPEILSERLIEEHKRKQCIKCKCLGYMQLRAISFIGQAYPKAYP